MADVEDSHDLPIETSEAPAPVPDDEGVVKKKRVMTEKQLEVLKAAREKALAHRKEKAAAAQKKKDTEAAAVELQKIKMDEFAKSVQDELDAAKKKRDDKEDDVEPPSKRARVRKQADPKKKATKRKPPSDDEWADFDDDLHKPGVVTQGVQRRIEPERMPYSYGMPSQSNWHVQDPLREAYDRRIANVKRNIYRNILPF